MKNRVLALGILSLSTLGFGAPLEDSADRIDAAFARLYESARIERARVDEANEAYRNVVRGIYSIFSNAESSEVVQASALGQLFTLEGKTLIHLLDDPKEDIGELLKDLRDHSPSTSVRNRALLLLQRARFARGGHLTTDGSIRISDEGLEPVEARLGESDKRSR